MTQRALWSRRADDAIGRARWLQPDEAEAARVGIELVDALDRVDAIASWAALGALVHGSGLHPFGSPIASCALASIHWTQVWSCCTDSAPSHM